MLFVDGALIEPAGNASLLNFLYGLASVQQGSQGLLACADPFQSTKFQCVSLLEHEQALLKWCRAEPSELVVGSAAATTCVVLVLLDRTVGCAWACHLVSPTVRPWLEGAMQQGGMAHPELYMAGGFSEPTGLGERTAEAVLSALHAAPLPVRVALLCAGSLNTLASGAPATQSLWVHLGSGEARRCGPRDLGPELARRAAAMDFIATAGPMDIWDTAGGRMLLPGFSPTLSREMEARCRRRLLLSDEELLHSMSTSPEYEGPEFVPHWRGVSQWLLDVQRRAGGKGQGGEVQGEENGTNGVAGAVGRPWVDAVAYKWDAATAAATGSGWLRVPVDARDGGGDPQQGREGRPVDVLLLPLQLQPA